MLKKNFKSRASRLAFFAIGITVFVYAFFKFQNYAEANSTTASIAATTMLFSLLLPLFGLTIAIKNPAKLLSPFILPVFAGYTAAILLISLFAPAGCMGATTKAVLVIAAFTASLITWALLLKLFLPLKVVMAVATLYLLLGVCTPSWSRPLLELAPSTYVQKMIVIKSPLLLTSICWIDATARWTFDMRVGVLYDTWVGTDIPFVYPVWWTGVLLHILAAAILWGIAFLVMRRAAKNSSLQN